MREIEKGIQKIVVVVAKCFFFLWWLSVGDKILTFVLFIFFDLDLFVRRNRTWWLESKFFFSGISMKMWNKDDEDMNKKDAEDQIFWNF